MRAERKIMKRIILIAILAAVTYIIFNLSVTKKDLSGDFCSEDIRKVQIGMSLEQVQKILGNPYEINALAGLHEGKCTSQKSRLIYPVNSQTNIRKIVNQKFADTNYCCEGNKDDLKEKRVTLVFTKPVEFSSSYPMLWIHLDSNFNVVSVFAKKYDGFLGLDDPAIYLLTKDELFEGKKLFLECFK